MNDKTVFLISTSHLDREWYFSFEQFRIQMCQIIDRVIGLLEKHDDYKCFMLDGQFRPVEDYLEIYPEQKEKIISLVLNGRLLIGPWYVQSDESIPFGESIIRNLLMGIQLSDKYGGFMKFGYLPDNFGHTAQMPQILNSFGIDRTFFTRGVDNSFDREFIWQAPNGSSVNAMLMEYGGCVDVNYSDMSNGIRMITDIDVLEKYILEKIKAPYPIPANDLRIIAVSCDHAAPPSNIMDIIHEINKRDNSINLEFTSYNEFFDKSISSTYPYKTITGELRQSPDIMVLKDTLVTRPYLKYENFLSQRELLNKAEPLCVFASLAGFEYPRAFLNQAWKYLLLNHTHDGICGCSIDTVHDEMMERFRKCRDISSRLSDMAIKHLAEHIDTSYIDDNSKALIIFNPGINAMNGCIQLDVKYKGDKIPAGITVSDFNGEIIPTDILHAQIKETIETDINVVQRFYSEIHLKLGIIINNINPYSYKTYKLNFDENNSENNPVSACNTSVKTSNNSMENEYISIQFNKNGTLDIFNKSDNKGFTGIHFFEDGGHAGDVYGYQPPSEDKIYDSRNYTWSIKLLNNTTFFSTFRLTAVIYIPAALVDDLKKRSEETRPFEICTDITLQAGQRYASVFTKIINNSKDHRFRVMFPTNPQVEYTYASSQFFVEKRPAFAYPGAHPQQGFVDAADDNGGLCIFNKGLHMYEVCQDDTHTLAISLMACQDTLYRGFFRRNQGFDGAQCLGENTFHYAIYPHGGDYYTSGCINLSDQYRQDLYAFVTSRHDGEMPANYNYFNITGNAVNLCALKGSEDGSGIVVRIYNSLDRNVTEYLSIPSFFSRSYYVEMDEKVVCELKISDNKIKLELPANKIATIKLLK